MPLPQGLAAAPLAVLLLALLLQLAVLLSMSAPVWPPLPTRAAQLQANASVVLLWWTAMFGQRASDHLWRPPHEDRRPACPKQCEVTSDRSRLADAQLVLFHASNFRLDDLPSRHVNGRQPSWVYVTMESPTLDTHQRQQPESMHLFDYVSSYRRDSDFPATYEPIEDLELEVVKPLPVAIEHKNKEAPVAWLATNCVAASNHREVYVKELFQHVSGHSYGGCLHNKDWPSAAELDAHYHPDESHVASKIHSASHNEGDWPRHYWANQLKLIAHYKFYLALENSNCLDYVTEKLFNTLLAGVVPIVNGPREMYEPFLPLPDAALFIDEYPHPAALAERIKYLHQNDTAYAEMLRYKPNMGYNPPVKLSLAFIKRNRVAMARYAPLCQMCIRAHEEREAEIAFEQQGRVIPAEGLPRSAFTPIRGPGGARPDTSCHYPLDSVYKPLR
jgi:hypothetical protein